MSAHEQMKARTEALEAAFYALLDACDDYRLTAAELLEAEHGSDEPREQLVHRLRQLSGRANDLKGVLEDDALTIMLPILDRLFALQNAERGLDV